MYFLCIFVYFFVVGFFFFFVVFFFLCLVFLLYFNIKIVRHKKKLKKILTRNIRHNIVLRVLKYTPKYS